MSNDNAPRRQFTVQLTCSDCGQKGAVLWEENSGVVQPKGPERRLVSITPGFHEESGRTQSRDPLIVCDVCDTIQDD